MDELVVIFEGLDAEEDQGAKNGDALVKFITLELPILSEAQPMTTVTLERISTMVLVMPSQMLSQ
jgi:hypothetical protein